MAFGWEPPDIGCVSQDRGGANQANTNMFDQRFTSFGHGVANHGFECFDLLVQRQPVVTIESDGLLQRCLQLGLGCFVCELDECLNCSFGSKAFRYQLQVWGEFPKASSYPVDLLYLVFDQRFALVH